MRSWPRERPWFVTYLTMPSAMGTPATTKDGYAAAVRPLRSNLTCSCGDLYETAPDGGLRTAPT